VQLNITDIDLVTD